MNIIELPNVRFVYRPNRNCKIPKSCATMDPYQTNLKLTNYVPYWLWCSDLPCCCSGKLLVGVTIASGGVRLLRKLPKKIRKNKEVCLSSIYEKTTKFVMKLKQVSERLDFIKRFPAPLTLEIIELRIKNFYYRSFEVMNHDIRVMLSNVRSYFAKREEMSTKMRRLSNWFERELSKVVELSFVTVVHR